MGLIIDTNVLVRIGRQSGAWRLDDLGDVDDMAVSAITISELLVGVLRANTEERRARRLSFADNIVEMLVVMPFELETARIYARIGADLQARGLTIGAHDLIIAATALEHGHDVLMGNLREFERVEGLKVIAYHTPA